MLIWCSNNQTYRLIANLTFSGSTPLNLPPLALTTVMKNLPLNAPFTAPAFAEAIPPTTIRVLLVDDQPFILSMLQFFLDNAKDIEVVGSAREGKTALDLVAQYQPDIALIDIEMPDMDGLVLTQMIVEQYPQTKVLVLSSYNEETYIHKALMAGARGYLIKGTLAEEIIHAIRYMQKGYLQLGPGLYEKLEKGTLVSAPEAEPEVNLTQAIAPESTAIEKSLSEQIEAERREWDWSPDLDEQLNTLPKVWTRGLLYFVVAFSAIALPWSFFARVDETGVARGRIEPSGATQRIDAPAGGTVTAVQVQEGQLVQRGQILLELETDELRSDLQQLQAKLTGQLGQLNQLEMLKNQSLGSLGVQAQQNQAQISEKDAQVNQARQTFQSGQSNLPLQEAEKLAQVDQALAKVNTAKQDLIRTNSLYQRDVEEIKRYRQLAASGLVPTVKVAEVERVAEESRRLRDQAEGEVKQAQQLLAEQQASYQRLQKQLLSDQQLAALQLDERQGGKVSFSKSGELALLKNQERLQELEGQITRLKTEVKQSQNQTKVIDLQIRKRSVRSPITGTIFELPIKKDKAFVQTGQLVAQIAPKNASLVVRAQIPSANSGFLKVGQPVKLKFDAYPYQDYGTSSGRLRWIAPNSRQMNISNAQVEVFDLEVTMDRPYLQAAAKQILLTPGQSVSAEIIVRQRRIIDFLLDPFRKLQEDGLKL
jgi:hemolysin D